MIPLSEPKPGPDPELGADLTFHPVHQKYHGADAPSGIRLANFITGGMGSWAFLIVQTIIVGIWVAVNLVPGLSRFDPYPFILLNLAFSLQAAYAAPLILMAGNVAAAKDRELWENDYGTNQKAYGKIIDLENQIRDIALQNQRLFEALAANGRIAGADGTVDSQVPFNRDAD